MSIVLGHVPPQALTDARLQAHHAAQLVAAAGASSLPPQADVTHTALVVSPERLARPSGPSGELPLGGQSLAEGPIIVSPAIRACGELLGQEGAA